MCPEVPLEHAQEEILHHAEHAESSWIMGVALTAALLAVLAAITALLAEHHANEATIKQIKSSDQWGFFQAKGLKASLLSTRIELLTALDKPASATDKSDLQRYKDEQDEIKAKAKELEEESEVHLNKHRVLSYGVTMFQVAIAIGAISVLTRRKMFWLMAILFGLAGLGFLVFGLAA